jgi:hypothetical protein
MANKSIHQKIRVEQHKVRKVNNELGERKPNDIIQFRPGIKTETGIEAKGDYLVSRFVNIQKEPNKKAIWKVIAFARNNPIIMVRTEVSNIKGE